MKTQGFEDDIKEQTQKWKFKILYGIFEPLSKFLKGVLSKNKWKVKYKHIIKL